MDLRAGVDEAGEVLARLQHRVPQPVHGGVGRVHEGDAGHHQVVMGQGALPAALGLELEGPLGQLEAHALHRLEGEGGRGRDAGAAYADVAGACLQGAVDLGHVEPHCEVGARARVDPSLQRVRRSERIRTARRPPGRPSGSFHSTT